MSVLKAMPIERRKLSDHIEERLLAELQSGKLLPGDLLPSERELMVIYAVGRPAVREAMQNLQRMGLIDIRHGERPRVAQPSLERALGNLGDTMWHVLVHSKNNLDHLKQARATFEKEMVRIAARSRTPEQISRLLVITDAHRRSERSSPVFLKMDGQFHVEIARVSGNPIFTALSDVLFSLLANFHAHLVHSPGNEDLTLKEHDLILQAICDGDADQAATEMSNHLDRANELYSVANVQNL
jgi:DNA-binding FadR family transcriptional regulator